MTHGRWRSRKSLSQKLVERLNFSAYTDKWSFCGGRKVSVDHIVWKEQTTKTKVIGLHCMLRMLKYLLRLCLPGWLLFPLIVEGPCPCLLAVPSAAVWDSGKISGAKEQELLRKESRATHIFCFLCRSCVDIILDNWVVVWKYFLGKNPSWLRMHFGDP